MTTSEHGGECRAIDCCGQRSDNITVIAGFLGPRWKDRVEARRSARQRSESLLAQYSEPLARTAFDLQSRLYNICLLRFLEQSDLSKEYRRFSTLWLLGQFLAWTEILRREVQVIDFGDPRKTAALQQYLFEVTDILAHGSSASAGTFHVYRAEQRAIGELMVIERTDGRSDSMGYAEFVRRMENDPIFARWFETLDADISAAMAGAAAGTREVFIQRALIDLIDFVDPQRIRFPHLDERGRIPLPDGDHDRKRWRPSSQAARFRVTASPFDIVDAWAKRYSLPVQAAETQARVFMPHRRFGANHDVIVRYELPWCEIHVVARDGQIDHRPADGGEQHHIPSLTAAEIDLVNRLLRRFDRPMLYRFPRQEH